VKELRRGKNGYVNHPLLGLISCLAYWARGSMAHAVTMIAALCVKLGISERVRDALPETIPTHEAVTNTKIVALLNFGHGELKHCRNEQQRIQFVVGLRNLEERLFTLCVQQMERYIKCSVTYYAI